METDKDWTKYELLRALKKTRMEQGGISLEEIANVMKEVYDKSEREALKRDL